jgi:hypothetical protein
LSGSERRKLRSTAPLYSMGRAPSPANFALSQHDAHTRRRRIPHCAGTSPSQGAGTGLVRGAMRS